MYKYFSLDELKCKCGQCGSTGEEMNEAFMLKVEMLREAAAFPFVISSAYRCPAHNAAVSSTGMTGAHTTGRALDILVSHENAYKLLKLAFEFGFTGVGVNQKGNSRFIHLDDLEQSGEFLRPTVWSY